MHRTIARFRTLFVVLGLVLSLIEPLLGIGALGAVGFTLIVLGVVLFFVPGGARGRDPVILRSPVVGRWVPVNSPADKVPSHGTHELGQTYAIDLVHVPSGEWTPMRRWPLAARPDTFPSFGRDVLAPADGVVVRASGRQRDHWSRNSWPGVLYLLVEGMVFRQVLSLLTLSAGRFVVGNSVVLELGDGVYAVFAHLRRGSLRVRRGDRVLAGDVIAEVGNSGNTSEPHLHFHLMDRSRPLTAAGIPLAFPYTSAGTTRTGVPSARHPFMSACDHAPGPPQPASAKQGDR